MADDIEVKSEVLQGSVFTAFLSNLFSSVDSASLHVDLDLSAYIDHYEYHDAPSSIDIWLGEDGVKALIAELQQCLTNMQKLEESLGGPNDSN